MVEQESEEEVSRALDRNFFAGLTHEKLAEHIFPDSFEANDKMDVIAHFCEEIFRLFRLRVTYQKTAHKWYPGTSPGEDFNGVTPVPMVFPKQLICDLYCSDCRCRRDTTVVYDGIVDSRYFHGEAHVVASLKFKILRNDDEGRPNLYRGTVTSLFYHYVHDDGGHFKQLMGAGWCILKTPSFVGDTYAAALEHCRKVLHPEKGKLVKAHVDLIPINRADKRPQDNRYYLMMSGETNEWDARVVNTCCNDEDNDSTLVQLKSHQRVMVTLFYLICNGLGLQEIASPFVYKTVNSHVQLRNAAPNSNHRLFVCEESVLVGGFSRSDSVQPQKLHLDHADAPVFREQRVDCYPPTADQLSELLKVGMSFIHPLSEEGRTIHFRSSSIHLTQNHCLVFLGNLPHGGATNALKKDPGSKKIWPAIHGHIDTVGVPRSVGLLAFIEEGFTDPDYSKKNKDKVVRGCKRRRGK